MTINAQKPSAQQLAEFVGTDVLNAAQFSMEQLNTIMQTAAYYEAALAAGKRLRDMDGKVMASLFFEPSTRTRLSFETAMHRLGGAVITVSESATSQTSSAAKGETMHDAMTVIDGYADVIVVRSPQTGSGVISANAAQHPVINAGDGAGQHPTQALLDIYTILKEKGSISGQKVALVGDLKNGRTVHSLSDFMALYGNDMLFVSPKELKMPAEITEALRAKGAKIEETEDLKRAAKECDVLYVTRVQKERFADIAEYERVKDMFIVDEAMIEGCKPGMIIMHPLPRVNEITVGVDQYAGAAYFRQAYNGLYVRMALLALTTGSVQ